MGFGLIIAVLGLGSTFAADININGQDPNTEFGQGVTKTVFCGALEEPITVTPISKFVNESSSRRLVSAARSAQNEVSFNFNYATSVYSTSSSNSTSDFIESAAAVKQVKGRTGVWLTKKGDSSSVRVADNQNELTFDQNQQEDYVFSQNVITRNIGSRNNVRGFWKVRDTATDGKIVITAAVTRQDEQYVNDTINSEFYFNGVVISDIPESCEGKNFIISGFGQTGEALPLIIEDDEDDSIEEITALWTGDDDDLKVSKSRLRFDNISSDLEEASQDDDRLEIVFGKAANYSRYQTTAALYRLVIETQEDTLSNGNNGGDGDGD
jgi:hypothetical protein